MDITRRDLLHKGAIGIGAAGVIGMVGLEGSCSTSTVLQDLDTIVSDGIIVSEAVASESSIAAPVFNLITNYLSSVKTAVDSAITVNNTTSLTTAQKASQIAEIFVGLAVANIPGLPAIVAPLVATLEVAINTLLGLLHATAASHVALRAYVSLPFGETHHVSSHNAKFGKSIQSAIVAFAKRNAK
jgi:hypothetical protein